MSRQEKVDRLHDALLQAGFEAEARTVEQAGKFLIEHKDDAPLPASPPLRLTSGEWAYWKLRAQNAAARREHRAQHPELYTR